MLFLACERELGMVFFVGGRRLTNNKDRRDCFDARIFTVTKQVVVLLNKDCEVISLSIYIKSESVER